MMKRLSIYYQADDPRRILQDIEFYEAASKGIPEDFKYVPEDYKDYDFDELCPIIENMVKDEKDHYFQNWPNVKAWLEELYPNEKQLINDIDHVINVYFSFDLLKSHFLKVRGPNDKFQDYLVPIISQTFYLFGQDIKKLKERILNDHDQDSQKLREKYDIELLTKQELENILKMALQAYDLKDYNYKIQRVDVKTIASKIRHLYIECSEIIEKLTSIIGKKPKITINFRPSPILENSTSNEPSAGAYWDPSDYSINFTFASVLYAGSREYVLQLTTHETAHMIDNLLGNPSGSPEFANLLHLIGFDETTQPRYLEYKSYGKKAEAFADLIVHWTANEQLNNIWPKLHYNREKNQLINEYFTGLIDRVSSAEPDTDENEDDFPGIEKIRNFEKKTSRLKKKDWH